MRAALKKLKEKPLIFQGKQTFAQEAVAPVFSVKRYSLDVGIGRTITDAALRSLVKKLPGIRQITTS